MYDIKSLFDDLFDKYRGLKDSVGVNRLRNKIIDGSGTIADLYDYVSILGDSLGKIIKETMDPAELADATELLEAEKARAMRLIESYYDDAAFASKPILAAGNKAMGMQIAPQIAAMDKPSAWNIADRITRLDIGTIDKTIENFGMKSVNNTIHDNADFLSNTGLKLKIVRTYDHVGVHTQRSSKGGTPWKEDCAWCKERAGSYDYLDVKDPGHKVWQRHEGCACSIVYHNESGRQTTVDNFVKGSKRNIREPQWQKMIMK